MATTTLDRLAAAIDRAVAAPAMTTKVVAIDGHGGAGKSTLARLLSDRVGGAPIIETDDFASWENPSDWWPRMLEQVLEPLGRNDAAHFQRYDWEARRLTEWRRVHPGGVVILEGVTASRRAFRPYLAYTVWVDAPAAERLRRGLERDGDHMLPQWQRWMAAEDEYVARERPDLSADAVIDGMTPVI